MSLEPPDFADLRWRPVGREDLAAVVELARACLEADGGLPFLFVPEVIQERYFPDGPAKGIGAFLPDGRLAACTTLHLHGDPAKPLVKITGQVRPDSRGQGLGGYLMRWSQAQAHTLLPPAPPTAAPAVLQVATESLTQPAHQLYLAHGYQCVFDELVMERDLRLPLPDRPLPQDVSIIPWQPALAEQFFQAYQAAFRERPGFPGYSAAEWIGGVTENDHKPGWSLLARVDGRPVGFVIGNIDLTRDPPGGHIWQVGVVPEQRRRGLASALLVETMRRMQAEGASPALLTVHLNNPGAIQAYDRLGFATIGRRARYERAVG